MLKNHVFQNCQYLRLNLIKIANEDNLSSLDCLKQKLSERQCEPPIILKNKEKYERLVFIRELEIGVICNKNNLKQSIEKACQKLLDKYL